MLGDRTPNILNGLEAEAVQMSLATLGLKLLSPIHHGGDTAPGAAQHRPQTLAERMAGERAFTRHAVLAALAIGSVTYGLLTVLARA